MQQILRECKEREQEGGNIENVSWLFKYYDLITQEEKQMKTLVKQKMDKS